MTKIVGPIQMPIRLVHKVKLMNCQLCIIMSWKIVMDWVLFTGSQHGYLMFPDGKMVTEIKNWLINMVVVGLHPEQ